ncbi:MAG: DUF1800 domain-containing protein [Gemmatimonadaceae bacterium]|nr:DUF1800 domain-containing protein [Gemmatimonadaceae bacterium]
MRSSRFRYLLILLAACGGSVAPRVQPSATAAASDTRREQTADQQVQHALNRLAFGARPGDVDRVRAMGVDRWIAAQLAPERIADARVESFVKQYDVHTLSAAELESRFPRPAQLLAQLAPGRDRGQLTKADSLKLGQAARAYREIIGDVQSSRVARAVASERQLQEVMTDFWLNHFTVFAGKGGPQVYFLAEYEDQAIRPNALGKFRTLLGAVAKSPAMLFYLDNWESAVDSNRPRLTPVAGGGRAQQFRGQLPAGRQRFRGLNENYGRELLELHTLGVDGGYTQADVIDAARALTGWSFRGARQGGGFQFIPLIHDAGAKTVLGHALRAGRGIEDGEELLDIVARHPATARHIATKLVRRFVSDVPPPALVARAAEAFTRTDGDLREVMRVIVTSDEFFAHDAYRSKVKSPFEVVVSALRATDAAMDPTPATAQIVATLGQPVYGHQAPNGWPETGAEWMNTGAILNRINFGNALAAGRVPGVRLAALPAVASLQNAPRDRQVDGVVALFLGGAVSAETRRVLVSGENPLLSSPAAMDSTGAMASAMVPDPDATMFDAPMRERSAKVGERGPLRYRAFGQLPPLTGVAQVIGLALGSPEFQRR